ncbi:hypothetical protein Acr_26g0000750 [Actinidia rufa]|uniref:Retrotransposon Copia-like N-terminal domain-containing protein n=1 Tax=Actinidia rufa TaxID=165716 RepID=A0A7J0H1B3_9ERIC|nr:hypothetical protein Acr_26g0000750 [Actinidia rufa]
MRRGRHTRHASHRSGCASPTSRRRVRASLRLAPQGAEARTSNNIAALPAASAAPAPACAAASSSHAIQPNTCAAPTQRSSTVQQFLRSPAAQSSRQFLRTDPSPAPKPPCAVCATIPHRGRQACVVQPSAQSSALRRHTSLFRVALMADPTKEIASIGPIPVAASSVPPSLSQPAQRVTSVLLNGKNFHAWSRSFQLYLDNCIILGWMFNSMEDRVYHMFMYHDTVHGLWTALKQMYAHARNESRIFELYRDISHASQPALGLLVADYFGYLQTRWEELAQYEPLSDFPSDGAVESKRLDRRHTYQFLMGLKPEFEALRTQILNTSPLPSLYEAFAIVDGDERRRRLLPSISLPETSSTVPDQTAFVAPFGTRPYCQHCHKPGHLIDRCFVLHPELKSQFNRNRGGGRVGGRGSSRGGGRATPRVGAIAEIEPMNTEIPNLNQLQTQIAQLQSHLGLVPSSSSSGPMANIAAESPTALHGPDFEEDFWQGGSAHPRPLPILDSPPPSLSGSHAPVPLPASSPDSGISSPVVSDLPSPRYPTRVRRPPLGFFFPIVLIILLPIICLT